MIMPLTTLPFNETKRAYINENRINVTKIFNKAEWLYCNYCSRYANRNCMWTRGALNRESIVKSAHLQQKPFLSKQEDL